VLIIHNGEILFVHPHKFLPKALLLIMKHIENENEKIIFLTLMRSRITMQAIPRTVSHVLVSFMARNRLSQFSMKVFPDARIPNMSLTCDVTMIRAAADVNPEETGPDMKSITNPVNIRREA
jgi:hypothetical protein